MNRRSTSSLIVAVAITLGLTLTDAAGVWAGESTWEHNLAVYGWLPTIKGELNYAVPEIGDSIEVDPDALLDNLQFTAMLAYAGQRGKWSILADLIYLKEAKSDQIPLDVDTGLDLRAEFDLEAWVVDVGGAYEVARGERSKLHVLAGVRYFSSDSSLAVEVVGPVPFGESVATSATIWNGVVGTKGQLGLSERWFVPFYLDLGTGDSDFTWQAMAGIGYGFRWGTVILGYRHLEFDQGDSGPVGKLSMSGAELGVAFRF